MAASASGDASTGSASMTNDAHTTIQELKDLVAKFRDERGWAVHHTPKNLAMSIAIEAAELMEHFQWDDYTQAQQQGIADELSDILAYCFNLADTLGIDVSAAYRDKIRRNAQKFPTDIFSPGHDDAAAYNRIKKEYRARKK
ncbi:MAG TPA: nucleotide pyrophosphohydrolase [Candidatus Saccharimonadales bacterium]|nr:nucleotide pyrophosphohydrolase [Candidatus Saccharimonadales bacterium]